MFVLKKLVRYISQTNVRMRYGLSDIHRKYLLNTRCVFVYCDFNVDINLRRLTFTIDDKWIEVCINLKETLFRHVIDHIIIEHYTYINNLMIYDMWHNNIRYKVDYELIAELNAQFKYIQI